MRPASLVVLGVAFLLTSCVQPTTMTPSITEEERRNEQMQQQAMLHDIQARGGQPKRWKSNPDMRKQFVRVAERIERAGAEMCMTLGLNLQRDCYYRFAIKSGKELNAYADGENIVVLTGMMAFVDNDEELALVMAHEMAHSLLGHVDAAKTNAMAGGALGLIVDALAASQGVDTRGQFTNLGADAGILRYSRGFEAEADYVGLYIMARAGYDISGVPYFWRRMSTQEPNGIYGGQSHPSNPERFIALNKTVTEIHYKRQNNWPLVPEFKPQPQ